jgi:predicted  nucleic acid-binding Zn-ribbon protein
MKNIVSVLFLALSTFTLQGQTLSLGSFNSAVLEENFTNGTCHFPLSTTTDNYFIIDDGDFFLNRNQASAYSVFAREPLSLKSYRVKTALKLGPSKQKTASVGLLINTSMDGQGAVAVEINAHHQYRLRQISEGKSKYISGKRSDEGWIDAPKLIKGIEEFNYLDVVCHNGSFDLYWNHQYAATYAVPEHQSGGLGVIIGGESKARVDFLHVYKQGEAVSYEEFTTANNKVLELEETLRQQKETQTRNEASIASLNSSISDYKAVESALNNQLELAEQNNNSLSTKIATLQDEKKSAQDKVNSLSQELSTVKSSYQREQEKNSQQASDLQNWKKKQADTQAELKETQDSKTTIANGFKALQQEAETQKGQLSNLKNKLAQTNSQLKSSQEKNKTLSAERSSLNTEVNNLKNKQAQLKKSLKEESNKQNNLSAQLKQLKTEKASLNTQLTEKKNEAKSLTTQLNSANNKAAVTQQSLDNKTAQFDNLEVVYGELENSIQEKNKIISSLSSKNQKSLDSLNFYRHKSSQLAPLKAELGTAKKKVESQTTTIAQLNNEKALLEAQLEEQKQIAAQFAQSYRYETQKNKLLQKDITISNNEIEAQSSTSSKTIYRVQLGTFAEDKAVAGLDQLTTIPTKDGQYIYISGKFDSYPDAKMHLMQVAEKGYKNAFIVKF